MRKKKQQKNQIKEKENMQYVVNDGCCLVYFDDNQINRLHQMIGGWKTHIHTHTQAALIRIIMFIRYIISFRIYFAFAFQISFFADIQKKKKNNNTEVDKRS